MPHPTTVLGGIRARGSVVLSCLLRLTPKKTKSREEGKRPHMHISIREIKRKRKRKSKAKQSKERKSKAKQGKERRKRS